MVCQKTKILVKILTLPFKVGNDKKKRSQISDQESDEKFPVQ